MMNFEEISAEKSRLRSDLRRRRRELPQELRLLAAEKVAERVISLEQYRKSRCILAYMAAKGELDVSAIVENARADGKKVAFPLCIENRGLKLLVPHSPDSFIIGAYGIMEPDKQDSDEITVDELDFIIVPGVGFDAECGRLGQGGGYYDCLLECSSAFTCGVGYDFQLCGSLPLEPHDKSIDCVAFPCGVFFRAKEDR